jgi:ureidoglycolate lyase
MSRVLRIGVEPLEAERFAPFGDVLNAPDRANDFRGVATVGWRFRFEAAGRTEIMILRTDYQGYRFSQLERHSGVTQAFMPIGGSPSVVVVGPPTDICDRLSFPSPEELRAFRIDGTAGYMLARGTWHSVDRLPLGPPDALFAMVTDVVTTDELVAKDGPPFMLTHQVDYERELGVIFEIVP